MEILKVKDVSKRLNISERAIQLRCKMYNVPKVKGRYQLTEDIVRRWQNEAVTERTKLVNEAKAKTNEATNQLDLEQLIEAVKSELEEETEEGEFLTPEQAVQVEKFLIERRELLVEVKHLRSEIDFLRNQLVEQGQTIMKVLQSVQQRNFIEAKDKGLDNP